jgi:hypothetical protein
MLSYADLSHISFADAIDDEEEAAEILVSNEFHALPVCEGSLLV